MYKQLRICLLVAIIYFAFVNSDDSDGTYKKSKYDNKGKYKGTGEEKTILVGRYKPDESKWKYVHYDDGDRGRYIHVHVPYDGGYGPYSGSHPPYVHDVHEQFDGTAASSQHPYNVDVYYINTPEIYTAYGLPLPSDKDKHNLDSSSSNQIGVSQNSIPNRVNIYDINLTDDGKQNSFGNPVSSTHDNNDDKNHWQIFKEQAETAFVGPQYLPAAEDKAFAASNKNDRKLDDDLFAPKKHNSVIIAKSKPLEPVYAYRAEDGKLYRIEFSGNREEADCNGPGYTSVPIKDEIPTHIQEALDHLDSLKKE